MAAPQPVVVAPAPVAGVDKKTIIIIVVVVAIIAVVIAILWYFFFSKKEPAKTDRQLVQDMLDEEGLTVVEDGQERELSDAEVAAKLEFMEGADDTFENGVTVKAWPFDYHTDWGKNKWVCIKCSIVPIYRVFSSRKALDMHFLTHHLGLTLWDAGVLAEVEEGFEDTWLSERTVNVLVKDTDVVAINETVELWNKDKTEVLATATTNEEGICTFHLAEFTEYPDFSFDDILAGNDETGDEYYFKLVDFVDERNWTWSSDFLHWDEVVGNGNEYPTLGFTGVILLMTFDAPIILTSEEGTIKVDVNVTGAAPASLEFMVQIWKLHPSSGQRPTAGGGMTVDHKLHTEFDDEGSGLEGAVGVPMEYRIDVASTFGDWTGRQSFFVWQFEMEGDVVIPQEFTVNVTAREPAGEPPPNGGGHVPQISPIPPGKLIGGLE